MVFSSFVFLLVFLPIILALYYICPGRFRNVVLLVASLIFYAWGEPVYVLIMLFSTVFDYTNGRLIEYFKKQNRPGRAKVALIVDVCGNLAILGFFKYADFVIENVNNFTGAGISLLHLALPIGISFYTFQTMSYTIDVYRGQVPAQHNILDFATYVTLFPQLIAGPIVQYKTIAEELTDRKVNLTEFSEGAFRFTVGLAKKVLLANQIGALWNNISQLERLSVGTAWLGAIAYSFQIYFDFSGYSDMAIGLGRMFGFHFLENFNFPYMSKTITEFWRRWHISLSSWFREYVYIPLGGNRKGMVRQLFNIMVVWMLTGLWHGANWNFVLWGVYYGVLLMIEKLFLLKWLERMPGWIGHLYSMFLVVIGWTIFAQTDMQQLGRYLKVMFGVGAPAGLDSDFFYFLSCNAVLLVLLVLCSIDHRGWLRRLAFRGKEDERREASKEESVFEWGKDSLTWTAVKPFLMVVLLVFSFAFLVGDSYNPFLYFRF
ncbi:MAG: MBOAT family protein [Lachnospiraceae bacterium]|nr:MBOAT family protein [Lachnospiraceae bacterium]